jgi:hypothetical protein
VPTLQSGQCHFYFAQAVRKIDNKHYVKYEIAATMIRCGFKNLPSAAFSVAEAHFNLR